MALASNIRAENFGYADRFTGFFKQLGERYARHRLYRQTLNEMSALSNRELRDLGLCRAQIKSIAWEHVYDKH